MQVLRINLLNSRISTEIYNLKASSRKPIEETINRLSPGYDSLNRGDFKSALAIAKNEIRNNPFGVFSQGLAAASLYKQAAEMHLEIKKLENFNFPTSQEIKKLARLCSQQKVLLLQALQHFKLSQTLLQTQPFQMRKETNEELSRSNLKAIKKIEESLFELENILPKAKNKRAYGLVREKRLSGEVILEIQSLTKSILNTSRNVQLRADANYLLGTLSKKQAYDLYLQISSLKNLSSANEIQKAKYLSSKSALKEATHYFDRIILNRNSLSKDLLDLTLKNLNEIYSLNEEMKKFQ